MVPVKVVELKKFEKMKGKSEIQDNEIFFWILLFFFFHKTKYQTWMMLNNSNFFSIL